MVSISLYRNKYGEDEKCYKEALSFNGVFL